MHNRLFNKPKTRSSQHPPESLSGPTAPASNVAPSHAFVNPNTAQPSKEIEKVLALLQEVPEETKTLLLELSRKKPSIDKVPINPNWVKQHSPLLRPVARSVAEIAEANSKTHEEFIQALETATTKFQQALEGKPYTLILSKLGRNEAKKGEVKSWDWLMALSLPMHKEALLSGNATLRVVDENTNLDHDDFKRDCVLIDDAAFSGNSMRRAVQELGFQFWMKRQTAPALHFIAPFATQKCIDSAERMDLALHFSTKMKTTWECLDKTMQEYLKTEMLTELNKKFPTLTGKFNTQELINTFEKPLYLFAHKVPDYMSLGVHLTSGQSLDSMLLTTTFDKIMRSTLHLEKYTKLNEYMYFTLLESKNNPLFPKSVPCPYRDDKETLQKVAQETIQKRYQILTEETLQEVKQQALQILEAHQSQSTDEAKLCCDICYAVLRSLPESIQKNLLTEIKEKLQDDTPLFSTLLPEATYKTLREDYFSPSSPDQKPPTP